MSLSGGKSHQVMSLSGGKSHQVMSLSGGKSHQVMSAVILHLCWFLHVSLNVCLIFVCKHASCKKALPDFDETWDVCCDTVV